MRRITITLPEGTFEQLAAEAHARRVSVSQLIREAIDGTVTDSTSWKQPVPIVGLVDNPKMTRSDRVDEVLAWRG